MEIADEWKGWWTGREVFRAPASAGELEEQSKSSSYKDGDCEYALLHGHRTGDAQ